MAVLSVTFEARQRLQGIGVWEGEASQACQGRTLTLSAAVGPPVYSFQSVISFWRGLATVTAGGGGAGREGFWHPTIRFVRVAVAKPSRLRLPTQEFPNVRERVTSDHDLQC